jgi:hypothetical protein
MRWRKHIGDPLSVRIYPTLIATKAIVPRTYGDTGAETYRGLLERRLAAKDRAKTVEDAAERERLGLQATGLKLVLNATFGKLGDPYSSLFDPAAMVAVTISGQLMLVDLVERLRRAGVRVLSVNTDGLFLRVKRSNKQWRRVLAGWQADTEMTLDVEPLRRLLLLATNRYATVDAHGKLKRKGAELKGTLTPFNLPNELVVADAVAEALLRDVPPEKTVWACADLVRFCRVIPRTGKAAAIVVDEADGSETELPEVTRWYKSRGSARKIVHQLEGGGHRTPSHAINVALALDLSDNRVPPDVDRSWYARRARKIVQAVPGYRHLSRKHLEDAPLAVEVYGRGLAPVPKRLKEQPAGSDPAAPTLLWDWPVYPTAGTYTGPKVGLLVLDVDDPAKFSAWACKNHSPLLSGRRGDFDGCLVSVRGGADPAEVRLLRARGKLLFRFDADGDHPLARMTPSRWLNDRGVEVFYGKGLPSVLGAGPDGTEYRLDGALGDAPRWLIDGLSPARRAGAGPSPSGRMLTVTSPADVPAGAAGLFDGTAAGGLEDLPKRLAELEPELGKASVGCRSKDLGEGRVIWVGRCPFEHESGSSTDGDLDAGLRPDGTPYVRCKHASCTAVPEVNRRLAAAARGAGSAAEARPAIEPTAITRAFLEDLQERRSALHLAPTGSGKTYAAAQAAAIRYRAGLATLIAVPTIRLAEEVRALLESLVPEAFRLDEVAEVYGRHLPPSKAEEEDDAEPDEGEAGSYPISGKSRIVIATHSQLGRRGFSRFVRRIWENLGPSEGRPAFGLIVDEAASLVRGARHEIPLAHRVVTRRDPDGTGGTHQPVRDCPKSNRSGSCANCRLTSTEGPAFGARTRFNRFAIRELTPPPAVEFDPEGALLRRVRGVVAVDLVDLGVGELSSVRVGDTTFAAPVLHYKGRAVDEATRRTAPTHVFQRSPNGEGQEPEEPGEVLGHMLSFAFRPVVTWEYPIGPDGDPVSPEDLAARARRDKKGWDDGVVFPRETCQVPRLRFTDLIGLERMRRFAEQHRVGVVLADATLCPADLEVLQAVWPGLGERTHPYPDRRVLQVAVATTEGYHGVRSVVGGDGRLVTAPLEAHGPGLVFCPTRRLAQYLFDCVAIAQPTARLAVGNYSHAVVRATLHREAPVGTFVTYSRGVLGLGANVLGVRHLLIDANAFRSIAGFTPGEISPEAFARMRSEERLALVLQNLGRVLRGEPGKTVVIFVLNADPGLLDALRTAPAILEGSELPPVFAGGSDLATLVAQADRWLAAGGRAWPGGEPGTDRARKPGRPRRKTKDCVVRASEEALKRGVSWREFSRRENPGRFLDPAELADLKARFSPPGKKARGPCPGGTCGSL